MRSVVPVIVESVFAGVHEAVEAFETACSEYQESVAQEARAEKRHALSRKALEKARFAMAVQLRAVREHFDRYIKPQTRRDRLPKGWALGTWQDFLDAHGLSRETVGTWLVWAGYVEGTSVDSTDVPVPSINEAREAARAAAAESEATFDPDTDGEPPAPVDLDIRLGDWRSVLADVTRCDALIVDPPYSARTHAAATTRSDGTDAAGLTPSYAGWSASDVAEFVAAWAPRTRGWMVALTDSELIPAWRDAYRAVGRYAFAPLPCIIHGMSVRISGDGPSSWAIYAMVSRPPGLLKWGTLPGAYVDRYAKEEGSEMVRGGGAGMGRGKPTWLTDMIVRDYSRESNLICDPMAGYGSTLLSALRSGRRAVGAEIDQEAHAEALRRAGAR